MVKTELRHSVIYEVVLNKDVIEKAFTPSEYKKEKKFKIFKNLYKSNISKIISLIEKYTGNKKWHYDFIPIYLVEIKEGENYVRTLKNDGKNTWRGFDDPVTIIMMGPKRMIYTLIHELVHLNIEIEKQNKMGCETAEKVVHDISGKVWKELDLGEDWRD